MLALLLIFAGNLVSCGGRQTAQIWTDRPEFAFYGEYFNTVQNQYKVSVRYIELPASQLQKSDAIPDIVVASWLKNNSTKAYFKSLDNLFGAKKLSRSVFYSRLLATGRIDRSQYLLPISFNIPALIFIKDRQNELSNQFTIDFDEIKALSKNYNVVNRRAYTRMAFSPLWNDNFLYTTAVLFETSFREASPLVWDAAALERSMDYVYDWTHDINTNNRMEEDFTFKYFFEPQEKLVQSGRILFSYMESSELFTLSEDSKNYLDFRWIMEQNKIPVTESLVYMGIPKRGKSRRAAKAFVQWFFKVENQRDLMDFSRGNRINETVFGICGGFSAVSPVTEQIFPLFYPDLLGRMPPSEFFTPPNVLPGNWAVIKERVVIPYLHERARERAGEIYPLEKRVSDWTRMNR